MENKEQLVVNLYAPDEEYYEINQVVADEYAPGAPVLDFAEERAQGLLDDDYKGVVVGKIASYIEENGPVREIVFDGHGSSGAIAIGVDADADIGIEEFVQRLHMEIPEGQFPDRLMFTSCNAFQLSENVAKMYVKAAQDLNVELVGSTSTVLTGLGDDTAGHFYSIKPDGTVEKDGTYENFAGATPVILGHTSLLRPGELMNYIRGDDWVKAFQKDQDAENQGAQVNEENYTALFNNCVNDMDWNKIYDMLPDETSPDMPPEVESLVELKGNEYIFQRVFGEMLDCNSLAHVQGYLVEHSESLYEEASVDAVSDQPVMDNVQQNNALCNFVP